MGIEDNLCNASMDIPSLFPPFSPVGLRSMVMYFLISSHLLTTWLATCTGRFYDDCLCVVRQELDQKKSDQFKGDGF